MKMHDNDALAELGIEPVSKTNRWLKLLLWLAILGAGAAASVYYWYPLNREVAYNYVTDAATKRDLFVTVSATGNLEPTDRVDVSSEQSGRVDAVLVDFNDRVEAGQVLAQLDTNNLEADVLVKRNTLISSEATVSQVQAALRKAELAHQRVKRLFELSGGKTPSQLDVEAAEVALIKAQADLTSANASVAVAQANLQASETELDKARILSPIDGVILSRQVEPGQTVAASLSAPTLFVLARDLVDMELHVDIDEADIGAIRVGQSATFNVDAYPEREFDAEIVQIRLISASAAAGTSNVVAYETVLAVRNEDLALLPGMTAIAEIAVASAPDALTVSNAALRFDPAQVSSDNDTASASQGGFLSFLIPRRQRGSRNAREGRERDGQRGSGSYMAQVWVLRDGAPLAVDVELGLSDGLRTQILSGDIQAGDGIITDMTQRRS